MKKNDVLKLKPHVTEYHLMNIGFRDGREKMLLDLFGAGYMTYAGEKFSYQKSYDSIYIKIKDQCPFSVYQMAKKHYLSKDIFVLNEWIKVENANYHPLTKIFLPDTLEK